MTAEINSGIYAITNAVSGKIYVGSAVALRGRWNRHRIELRHGAHYNPHFQRSWSRYGEEAFEFMVLEYVDNLEELTKVEQFWMDKYREEGRELYNIALAADCPMRGRSFSKEHRHKISEALMGIQYGSPTEEHRRKISESNMGHSVSEETRRKISKALTGRNLSEEHKRKIGEATKNRPNGMLGKKHSKETRRKMSESAKHRPSISEETRYKLGIAARNRSEETRRKLSEAAKEQWARCRESS